MPNPTADPRPFEAGGLPLGARRRVLAAARGDLFTSTFTTAELAVARLAGYQPIGQVMGSSVYHVGWSGWQGGISGELTTATEAKEQAWALTLGRLAQEADLLGAHAVVAVKLAARRYEWSGPLTEFTALGTAVRVKGAPPVERPALSNLGVLELYKLELAGLWPVDIVLGTCVWRNPHADCYSEGSWFNQELPGHTACLDQAQGWAMRRFKEAVRARGALGALGVKVVRRIETREEEEKHTSFTADVLFLGTAVARRTAARLPRPRLMLDLGDRQIDLDQVARAPREER